MEVIIAIDDVHPEQGWGLQGDTCMGYLEELNKEFGAKFTLFIPSNYHNKFPISKHKEWIDWLKSKKYFELAAHGHYHMCERTDIGECEFFELDTKEKVMSRIDMMLEEWKLVDHKPIGWRNPGWLAHPEAVKCLGSLFNYAALHYEHNHNMQWDCKMLYGADGIDKTDISTHEGNIMFQSHIAGSWNDNVWNETNYEQLRLSLEYLKSQNVTFSTIQELI
jgi:predicted deacetylase